MSENKEETKQIKISVDDEAVEQLVENRFTDGEVKKNPRKRKPANRKRKKKKKKEKHIVLKTLIVILSFILVFVVSFLVSYTYFTARNDSADTYQEETADTVKTEADGKPKELDASKSAEYTPQPDEIFVEEKKPDEVKKSEKENQKSPSTTQKKPILTAPDVETSEEDASSEIVDNEENSEGLDLGI